MRALGRNGIVRADDDDVLAMIRPSTVRRTMHRFLDRRRGKPLVHCLHIGKTGGTALKHALAPHRHAASVTLELHDHAVTLQDVPVGERVIFVVRDPIARFISGFYSRQRQGRPRHFWRWTPSEREAFAHFSTPNDLALGLLSGDAETRGRAVTAMKSIRHVSSSYWDWFRDEAYFRSRLPDVLYIGFQERLEADFEMLKTILGLPGHLKLPIDDVHAHKNPRDLDRTLDPPAAARITEWYARDYAFLRLCMDLAPRINTAGASDRRRADLSRS
jgi:sulfotransferase famil protein